MRNHKNKRIFIATLVLLSALAGSAHAAIHTLGFDTLANGLIPAGYGALSDNGVTFGGFTATNFVVTDATNPTLHPLSAVGFAHGVASPKNVAYNSGGTPASLGAGSSFVFVGGKFTAWFDLADFGIADGQQTLTVQGFRGADLIFERTQTLSPFSQLAIAGDPEAIDRLRFSGTLFIGGQDVQRPLQWMMDDFQYRPIPEAQLVLQLGVGMLMLFALTQRRRLRA